MSSRSSRRGSLSLFIRRIPDFTRPDELRMMFERYGPVRDVYVPHDYYTRRPRGFAYVEFEDSRDAEEALYGLDRARFHGKELEIEFASGDRKTANDMRRKYGGPAKSSRRSRSRSPGRRRRYSRSYSRSRSPSPKRSSRRRRRERSRSRSSRSASEHERRSKSRSGSAKSTHSNDERAENGVGGKKEEQHDDDD